MKRFFLCVLLAIPGILSCQEFISNAISADDHKRKRPLMEALEAGFTGIAADISLSKDGILKCGGKPFEDLYLKPLKSRAEQHSGHIYPARDDEFFLVLTVESDSIASFAALEKVIGIYSELFSRFENGIRSKKAIRLVLSGNVPVNAIVNSTVRWCFPDENIKLMRTQWDGRFIAMATMNYKKSFDWNGEQNMPNRAYISFISYVKNAHKAGRLVRLQNAPENTNALGIFLEAGVDFIEVEDIPAFVRYWKNR